MCPSWWDRGEKKLALLGSPDSWASFEEDLGRNAPPSGVRQHRRAREDEQPSDPVMPTELLVERDREYRSESCKKRREQRPDEPVHFPPPSKFENGPSLPLLHASVTFGNPISDCEPLVWRTPLNDQSSTRRVRVIGLHDESICRQRVSRWTQRLPSISL
jgi:hypothetical protein